MLLYCCAAAIVICRAEAPSIGVCQTGPIAFFGTALFVTGTGMLITSAATSARLHGMRLLPGSALAVAIAIAVGSIGPVAWTCLFATLVFASSALDTLRTAAEHGRAESPVRVLPEHFNLAWLSAIACVGWMWTELWRDASGFVSLAPLLTWFCTGLLCILVWREHSLSLHTPAWLLFVAGAGCTAALCLGLAKGIVACGACALVACLMDGCTKTQPRAFSGALPWHSPVLAIAFGLCAGLFVTNIFTLFTEAPGISHPIGSAQGTKAVAYAVGGVVGCSLLIACLAESVCARSNEQQASLPIALDDEERLRAYLASRALTSAQADVVVCFVQGMSVPTTAAHLGYADSTIRSLRRGAYQTLGVRSRQELQDMLNAQLKL